MLMLSIWESFEDDTPAVIIMDNFKGQVTSSVSNLLEENNIHTWLLPPNTTDRLHPIDLSINKLAKDFLKRCFEEWYAEQTKQLEGKDIETAVLQPIELGRTTCSEGTGCKVDGGVGKPIWKKKHK